MLTGWFYKSESLLSPNFFPFGFSYHAGMEGPARRAVQNRFMNSTLRVIVATIAFGMGLNKRFFCLCVCV
jgi:hypothetical protein